MPAGMTLQREELKRRPRFKHHRMKKCQEPPCEEFFYDDTQGNKRKTCSPACSKRRHLRLTLESIERLKSGEAVRRKTFNVATPHGRNGIGEPEWIIATCPFCRKSHKVDGRRFGKWTYCSNHQYLRSFSNYGGDETEAEMAAGVVR